MKNDTLTTIIRWLVVIATPLLLTTLTVRVLIAWNSPSYPAWEYQRIAPDRFGFSQEERLELAEATLDYLQRSEPASDVIYLLEDLRLPGTDNPVYNVAEIGRRNLLAHLDTHGCRRIEGFACGLCAHRFGLKIVVNLDDLFGGGNEGRVRIGKRSAKKDPGPEEG